MIMTIFYGLYKWKANYYHDIFILQQEFDLSTKVNSIKFARCMNTHLMVRLKILDKIIAYKS